MIRCSFCAFLILLHWKDECSYHVHKFNYSCQKKFFISPCYAIVLILKGNSSLVTQDWYIAFQNLSSKYICLYSLIRPRPNLDIIGPFNLLLTYKTQRIVSFSDEQLKDMTNVIIMCRNDELRSTMSWVVYLLKEKSQILLKISVIPILLTFIYLLALNLLVNNQLNSLSNSTHHCGT